jgi:hypothetical protein
MRLKIIFGVLCIVMGILGPGCPFELTELLEDRLKV